MKRLLILLVGGLLQTEALRADPVWAACDGAAVAQPLASPLPSPLSPLSQPGPHRLHWLDADRFFWPGASPGAQLRLRHEGQDWALEADPQPWPAALQRAASYLGAGQAFRVPAQISRAQRQAWLRGELLGLLMDPSGPELARTGVQVGGAVDALYAAAEGLDDLGVHVQAGAGTQGRLWAPTARAVEVCLYPSTRAPAARRVAAQWQSDTGSWIWHQPGDLRGWTYLYLVEVWVPGQGWVRQRVTDPYSLSLSANSARSAVLDLDDPQTQPPGWKDHPRPQRALRLNELVIYELHVRDFSRDDRSLPAALRGRYSAFAQARSTGVRHLRALAAAGVTDVQLLPVFDLASVPEQGCRADPPRDRVASDSPRLQARIRAQAAQDCFNWGYDPLHFNAPEGSYASDADRPELRVRELRAAVMALHGMGLRVGMDMVYNHMAASGQARHSVLDRIVPLYYHRLNGQGDLEQSTCCANSATERLMMGKLMRDSVHLWARAYAMDSFRFDLMGHQPRAEMQRLHRELQQRLGREIHFIGEGWNFGEVKDGARFEQASQLSLGGSGIATFSDRARDALRGSSFGPVTQMQASPGWLFGLADDPARREQAGRAADLLRLGLAGSLQDVLLPTADGAVRRGAEMDYGGQPAGYARQPGEAVAYAENHDNHTLFDLGVLKLPPSSLAAARRQVQHLANALVAFSQGPVYFHAGQELMRSKSLDRNSYDSGDAFNRLDLSLRDNGFGVGLPPAADNGVDWPVLRPFLRRSGIRPDPATLHQAREQFLALLRVRASSSLFSLPNPGELQARLRFHAVGPDQDPAVIVAELDGRGWPGAGFEGLLLAFNAAAQPRQLALQRPGAWRLHPALQGLPDTGARWVGGQLRLPARSVAVFVH
ncbi:pullulanase/glycogen debranching enzyme [Inhella inkyongensis]|uniref:Pullulanase/glycogen debranching enzyme n=1 Tax=Inhella inkyongensis TaxID=392593 RepID=A0A840SBG5_9BURK|nr:alpha-1,6-glucosidase domain-containing protein [Inhella inkyongensis]MBB5206124.1 pullulanase/glycogen debranching enzyme [Inhella inkyongensis]